MGQALQGCPVHRVELATTCREMLSACVSKWVRRILRTSSWAVAENSSRSDTEVQNMKVPRVIGLSYATEYDEVIENARPPAPTSPISLISPVATTSQRSPSRTITRRRSSVVKLEGEVDESVSAPAAASRAKPSTARVKDETTAEERRNVLLQDGRCTDIEPQSVLCTMCNRRVGLHAKKDYSLSNWFKHARSCLKTDGK